MWPNSQFPANYVLFAEEILNLKLPFLCRIAAISVAGVRSVWSERGWYNQRWSITRCNDESFGRHDQRRSRRNSSCCRQGQEWGNWLWKWVQNCSVDTELYFNVYITLIICSNICVMSMLYMHLVLVTCSMSINF